MEKVVNLFLAIIGLTHCKIFYLNTSTCTRASQGYSYTTVQTGDDYLASVEVNTNLSQFLSYEPVGQSKIQYEYQIGLSSGLPELRVPPSNIYSNGSFLTTDWQNVYLHSGFNSSSIKTLALGLAPTSSVSDMCFGNNLNEILVLVQTNKNYTFYIFNGSQTQHTSISTFYPSTLVKDIMECKNNRVFINFKTKLIVLSLNSTLNLLYMLSYPNSMNIEMNSFQNLVAFSYDSIIILVDYTTGTVVRNVSILGWVTGLRIMSPFLMICTNNTIFQYDYQNNLFISNMSLKITFNQRIFSFGSSELVIVNDFYISPYLDKYMYFFGFDSEYQCLNCTTCPPGYGPTGIGFYCQKGLNTTNTTNTANTTNTSTNTTNTSTNTTNTANTTNTSTDTTTNTTNSTNTSSNASSIIDNQNDIVIQSQNSEEQIKNCFSFGEDNVCNVFCNFRCQQCEGIPTYCTTCSPNRQMVSPGLCQMTESTTAVVTAISLANNFRVGSAKGVFFLLDNFEKYKYHKTNYTGAVRVIIDQLNDIENLKWNIAAIDAIVQWSSSSIEILSKYNAYTNPRFLETQRNNAFLLESIKSYLALYIPLNVLLAVILNRIFYCVSHFRFSQIFRTYSFWLQIFIVVLLSNASSLCFLSMSYLKLLFSFSFIIKLMHAASIFLVGFFIIVLLSLFYMSQYLYDGFAKYFLINVYRIKLAFGFNFLLFSVRPLIEAALHVTLFENPQLQLIILTAIQILFFLVSIGMELLKQIYKSKFMFLCDSTLSFLASFLNILLILKHFEFNENEDLNILIENCIQIVCNVMMGVTAFALLLPFFSIFDCFCQKSNVSRDIWNWGDQFQIERKAVKNGEKYKKYKEEIVKKKERKLQNKQQLKIDFIEDLEKQNPKEKCLKFKKRPSLQKKQLKQKQKYVNSLRLKVENSGSPNFLLDLENRRVLKQTEQKNKMLDVTKHKMDSGIKEKRGRK